MRYLIHSSCGLALCSLSQAAFAQDAAMTVADVEAATAMELAVKVLPPRMAAEVVSGEKRRQFIAGPNYWIGYLTEPVKLRGTPDDFCTRFGIEVRIAPVYDEQFDPNGEESLRRLLVEKVERIVRIAKPLAGDASLANCAKTEGYIARDFWKFDKQISGYRQLVELIRAARTGEKSPQSFECRVDDLTSDNGRTTKCENKHAELAELPLPQLFDISFEDDPDENELKGFQASFGPSGADGLSWRVSWEEPVNGEIPKLQMWKQVVIYH